MSDSQNKPILYRTENDRADIHLRVVDGAVWRNQHQIADLFDANRQNFSLLLCNVLDTGNWSIRPLSRNP